MWPTLRGGLRCGLLSIFSTLCVLTLPRSINPFKDLILFLGLYRKHTILPSHETYLQRGQVPAEPHLRL
jgi:hypothetical protein